MSRKTMLNVCVEVISLRYNNWDSIILEMGVLTTLIILYNPVSWKVLCDRSILISDIYIVKK